MILNQEGMAGFSPNMRLFAPLMRLMMPLPTGCRPAPRCARLPVREGGGRGVARAAGRWSHVGSARKEFSPKWAHFNHGAP